jgi:hypothetical protein
VKSDDSEFMVGAERKIFFLNLEHHYDPNSLYVAPPFGGDVRSTLCISRHFKVEVSLMDRAYD